ncbi:MAG: hypothetical protein ACXWV4_08860, partial [Flavitalea sp.]
MKKIRFISSLLAILILSQFQSSAQQQSSVAGWWDMVIYEDGKVLPSWLEIEKSGVNRLIGSYVGPSGSARPVGKIINNGGTISFSLPPQWESENNDPSFEGKFQGDSLSGTMVAANGKTYKWSA